MADIYIITNRGVKYPIIPTVLAKLKATNSNISRSFAELEYSV